MADKYSEYTTYPGRQIYYIVIPRKFEHFFFEGVQSVDAASNANEVTHGQFGFKSDVIIARDYQNTSGTFNLKEFNNASFCLRGMTGVSPSKSFIFDPSRLEHVDVAANVFNKTRSAVMRSTWFVDFMPSVSENESLDDIQTKDISYTAIRKLDFEGYQIVVQDFVETKMGDKEFTLFWPALIDPTVQTSVKHPVGSPMEGLTTGTERHELCPIQFMLRVWVDGEVLTDPTQAAVVTKKLVSGDLISTLVLATPLASDGQIVKAMWLAEGTDNTGQMSVTPAPVMVDAVPGVNRASGTPTFDGILTVRFSELITSASLANLDFGAANTFDNFELAIVSSSLGTTFTMSPSKIGPTTGSPATFMNNTISGNELVMDFNGSPDTSGNGGTIANFQAGDTAILYYRAANTGLPLRDEEGDTTPAHTVAVMTIV